MLNHIFIIVSKELEPERFKYLSDFLKGNDFQCEITFREPFYKGRDEYLFNHQKYVNLRPGEIGIAQTYEYLLKDILQNFLPGDTFLILESDVLFQVDFMNNFLQVYEEFKSLTSPRKVCFLGDGCNMHPRKEQQVSKWIYQTGSTKCMDSMLMTHETVQELYQCMTTNIINKPVDHIWNDFFKERNINSYWIEPAIIKQGSACGVYKSMIR
jgi:GR25 family glycosyltransferase involved in LPS biosynthesis